MQLSRKCSLESSLQTAAIRVFEGRRIGTMTLALLLALLGSLMAMGFIIRRLERG
ncbi:hypothetical protein sync_1733 [Synechococcus sp. CC9311]|nr:hypothetical protein sync_1733 [Synechococcus sp. CC9311]